MAKIYRGNGEYEEISLDEYLAEMWPDFSIEEIVHDEKERKFLEALFELVEDVDFFWDFMEMRLLSGHSVSSVVHTMLLDFASSVGVLDGPPYYEPTCADKLDPWDWY